MTQPKSSKDFLNRAISKIENGAVQEGLEDLNIAIKKDKNNNIAYKRRGIVRRDTLGDYEGAIEDFNKELRIVNRLAAGKGKRVSRILLDLGITNQLLEKHQNAIDFFSKAIDIDPQSIQAYKLRGQSKKSIDDIEGSKEDFEKASDLVKNPNLDLKPNKDERPQVIIQNVGNTNTSTQEKSLLGAILDFFEGIANIGCLIVIIVIIVLICMMF